MRGYLRIPSVRLGLAGAAVLAALVAFRFFSASPDEQPIELAAFDIAPPPAAEPAVLPLVDAPLTFDALGAPDDPLPAPLELLPTGDPVQGDAGAEALARQITEGGAGLLPALVTALQASGIGIIGPENAVAAKPAEPWQGIVMQRWEVRLAAAMMLRERSVTMSLADFGALIGAAVPELGSAQVEHLILADLRALAESPVPTRRFFGRFVAALGRNAVSHDPYDLLTGASPQPIRLDGLQASLVLRRLSLDALMLGGNVPGQTLAELKKSASIVTTVHEWLVPTLHAQGLTPCAMSERTQQIFRRPQALRQEDSSGC